MLLHSFAIRATLCNKLLHTVSLLHTVLHQSFRPTTVIWEFESQPRQTQALIQVVTAPLRNARQYTQCHRSSEMTIINGWPVSEQVWHAKEPSLLKDRSKIAALHRQWRRLQISEKCSSGTNNSKQTNNYIKIFHRES